MTIHLHAWMRRRQFVYVALLVCVGSCVWATEVAKPGDEDPEKPTPGIVDPTGFETRGPATHTADADVDDAEVVDLPAKKSAAPAKPSVNIDLDTSILKEREADERAYRKALAQKAKSTVKPLESTRVTAPDTALNPVPKALAPAPVKLSEPGYASVLSGTLAADTELTAETLPHLIRGSLLIPPKITLKIGPGALVHLRAATGPAKPVTPGSPDPAKSAVIWVYGTLVFGGETGKPVELTNQEKDSANLLFYGADKSDLRGGRMSGVDVAQNGGTCLWTNCEFNASKFYLLAAGGGLFTHCSFKKCGGIFAAYDEGPWALLARRCLFENCENGMLFNHDPGTDCLLVEKNNFVNTKGAHLRAMPRPGAASARGDEVLIGANWYGTTVEEEIDRRIVDRRTDPTLKTHINTRPPADKPYGTAGAGASSTQVVAALQEQQNAMVKMIQALTAKQKAAAEKRVALDKSARVKAADAR